MPYAVAAPHQGGTCLPRRTEAAAILYMTGGGVDRAAGDGGMIDHAGRQRDMQRVLMLFRIHPQSVCWKRVSVK
jgi:hypothetical protein